LADEPPLVRAMAVWALSKLLSAAEFAVLAEQYTDSEMDPDVLSEWKSALHDRS
jgi:epoxyqueuosine reductase